MLQSLEFEPLVALPLARVPRLGHNCIGPSCDVLVLSGRICSACMAETAAACAQQFESQLIAYGEEPGTDELRAALCGAGVTRPVDWYQRYSPLGQLTFAEALELRYRTDAACELVSLSGVAALRNLPGLERNFVAAAKRGVLDFAALPGRIQGAPDPVNQVSTAQRRNMCVAAAISVIGIVVLVCR